MYKTHTNNVVVVVVSLSLSLFLSPPFLMQIHPVIRLFLVLFDITFQNRR